MLQCKQVIAEDRKKELVEKMANLANSNLLYESMFSDRPINRD